MEAGVVREWLDGVHSGYGDRFTPALEEYGVEDLQDLALLATTDKDELDKIFTDAGAKKMQLLNIHKGIELLTSSVPSPAPPEFPAPETAVAMKADLAKVAAAKKAEDKAAASRDWWIQNPPMMGFSF